MTEPLVSVIMGTYNRVKFLREAIDSVLNQTYRNIEFIVVDDASTDDTVKFVESYGDRIRLVRRTKNSGICGATKNDGMKAARGKYFAFQDSDDEWYPQKIEKQVAFMEAHPEVPLCHTYCEVIDGESRTLRVRHENRLPPTGRQFSELLRHCYITIGTIMIRRELADEIGGFAEDALWGCASEDHHFFLRVARRYPIGLVPEVLARYRVGAEGSMASAKGWKSKPEVLPFIEQFLDHPELWEGTVPRGEVVDTLIYTCLENNRFWRDRGFNDRALFFIREAMKARPFDARVWEAGLKTLALRLARGGAPKNA